MFQGYNWLQWVIPYHQSQRNIALPYHLTLELFASLESTGMRINSSSRFNQGNYRVKTNGNLVNIKGPFRKQGKFPLAAQIFIQPPQIKNETSIYIKIRPTFRALFPISFLCLSMPTFFVFSGAFEDLLSLNVLMTFLLYPYAIIIIFFNIEMGILMNVLQEQIKTRADF
ncbi:MULTISPECIES: hypothetical protein [unclassified Nodularia (in: cyanobacteria)]|uniref:hypothetical protein n=1 Tax=unclassified Nodularia (in: cyanobacteria) TaxID=2656917 RepID=UPI0018824A0B|nr:MULTISPECIES: hypothetical protein [unclassified Nodularia (in: cyanobacteria)]MBE9199054.1 hypothetical protein [Nodularia sp. LEGE 06071]MCC2694056.1 hypothetical protein [Nodularia sp. LEGE 04288]